MNQVEDKAIDITRLEHDGKHYSGWIIPSDKKNVAGEPTSYHVVLDNVFFGNLSHDGKNWSVDDQRPGELVQAVGKYIEEEVIPHLHGK